VRFCQAICDGFKPPLTKESVHMQVSHTAPPKKPLVSPLIVMAVGVLAISTGSIFIRFAQAEAPSLIIAAYRLILAMCVLAPYGLARNGREIKGLKKRDWSLGLLSGFFLALHFATWVSSLEYTSVASSVIFVNTAPLWVALASPFFLKERLSLQAWIGVAIATLGGIIVAFSDACAVTSNGVSCNGLANFFSGPAFFGNFLALAGAWTLAGYLMIGRGLRRALSLTSYIVVVYGFAMLMMIAVAMVMRLSFFGYSLNTYLWLGLLALFPQLVGHSASNYALGYLPAALVAVALLGEPVGATILASLLLHEVPTAFQIFGGILTLIGIYLVSRER
jgi:drug/metabolite transporter (DMT)-like permease